MVLVNFCVSLHPTDIDLGDEFVRLMECVRDVWPRFVKKGTLVLSLEPQDESADRCAVS